MLQVFECSHQRPQTAVMTGNGHRSGRSRRRTVEYRIGSSDRPAGPSWMEMRFLGGGLLALLLALMRDNPSFVDQRSSIYLTLHDALPRPQMGNAQSTMGRILGWGGYCCLGICPSAGLFPLPTSVQFIYLWRLLGPRHLHELRSLPTENQQRRGTPICMRLQLA